MSLVGGTGELDKQVDGIHENLLLLKIREANFNKLTESLDWFTFYDNVGRLSDQSQLKICASILGEEFLINIELSTFV